MELTYMIPKTVEPQYIFTCKFLQAIKQNYKNHMNCMFHGKNTWVKVVKVYDTTDSTTDIRV